MYIYIPFYDRGWHIQKADVALVRRLGKCYEYRGTCYGDKAYKTESGAQAWIDKEYNTAIKDEYNPKIEV